MSETQARLAAVQAVLATHALDALIVTQAQNRRYLTGFTGSAGMLVVFRDAAHLIADSRYYEQIPREAPHVTLERAGYATLKCLGELLAARGAVKVGLEGQVVTLSQLQDFREKVPGIDWQATSGLVEQQRVVKSDSEVEALVRAIALSDAAMARAFEIARPGMTEAALAWALELFMRENGAEGMPFDIIVGAGENSALPHYRAGNRVIQAGDPVVVDMGATLDGYHSDITRTFTIGPATDPDYDRVYAIVDEANRAATAGLRVGLTGSEADALGRKVIEAAGYGEQFGHSLGHGVGLEIHEGPRLSQQAGPTPLAAGMVFTVEPGIYLPGRFGVRIEDMVVLRDSGAQVLTQAPKPVTLEPA